MTTFRASLGALVRCRRVRHGIITDFFGCYAAALGGFCLCLHILGKLATAIFDIVGHCFDTPKRVLFNNLGGFDRVKVKIALV